MWIPTYKAPYDKVNNVFYGNSGSGTFIGGSTTGEYIYE